jgi:hypothetical protein
MKSLLRNKQQHQNYKSNSQIFMITCLWRHRLYALREKNPERDLVILCRFFVRRFWYTSARSEPMSAADPLSVVLVTDYTTHVPQLISGTRCVLPVRMRLFAYNCHEIRLAVGNAKARSDVEAQEAGRDDQGSWVQTRDQL